MSDVAWQPRSKMLPAVVSSHRQRDGARSAARIGRACVSPEEHNACSGQQAPLAIGQPPRPPAKTPRTMASQRSRGSPWASSSAHTSRSRPSAASFSRALIALKTSVKPAASSARSLQARGGFVSTAARRGTLACPSSSRGQTSSSVPLLTAGRTAPRSPAFAQRCRCCRRRQCRHRCRCCCCFCS